MNLLIRSWIVENVEAIVNEEHALKQRIYDSKQKLIENQIKRRPGSGDVETKDKNGEGICF